MASKGIGSLVEIGSAGRFDGNGCLKKIPGPVKRAGIVVPFAFRRGEWPGIIARQQPFGGIQFLPRRCGKGLPSRRRLWPGWNRSQRKNSRRNVFARLFMRVGSRQKQQNAYDQNARKSCHNTWSHPLSPLPSRACSPGSAAGLSPVSALFESIPAALKKSSETRKNDAGVRRQTENEEVIIRHVSPWFPAVIPMLPSDRSQVNVERKAPGVPYG